MMDCKNFMAKDKTEFIFLQENMRIYKNTLRFFIELKFATSKTLL